MLFSGAIWVIIGNITANILTTVLIVPWNVISLYRLKRSDGNLWEICHPAKSLNQ